MARIEKIVIIILIITALAGALFSYYLKRSRQRIEIIPFRQAAEIEKAKDVIEQRLIIDINSADKETLIKIPGIGPYLAQNIIDHRREYGIFGSLDEIMKVKGIGPKKYEGMKEYIKVDESR